MEKIILQIAQKKYTGESVIVSMRMQKDMLKDIDEVARVSGRTRNEILTTALEFSLQHMAVTASEEKTVRERANHGNHQMQDVRRGY